MAIYHLSGTVISRSQGRSAVASAAYRAAEKLVDERYDKVHDYTKKDGVAYTEILLPEGAPNWMQNREALWNTVEQVEKRKDAQLAREVQISLPRELTLSQNIELAREFVQTQFVSRGMVADLCIHNDKTQAGDVQPHAHILLSLREVRSEGFGQKVRAWNAKENLLLWREAWAETANRHLALQGLDLRIDHRSYQDQGIALVPQSKIGTAVAYGRLARLAEHEAIARANGETIYADPSIALEAITRQQSTFTHQDVARFVNRHTVDAEQFQRVYEKVKADPSLIHLGLDEKRRVRYTTERMLAIETQMLGYSQGLDERTGGHAVKEAISSQVLARQAKPLTEEQTQAYQHLLRPGDIQCVVGYAGTGKSHLLNATRQAWERAGYQVQGVTLSGIAAENLANSSGIESRTLASRLYYWEKGEQHLTKDTVLVVDEAGMLGSRQMERLLKEVHSHGAKVVLVGDPWQLQAIEAGAAFRAISERTGYVELTDVYRQRESWQKDATQAFAQRRTEEGLGAYVAHDCVKAFETQAVAKQALVEQWFSDHQQQPEKSQLMLAYTRMDVKDLNEQARGLRVAAGELGESVTLETERGLRALASGDRIYFLENNRELGVKNGSLGTIEKIEGQQLSVRLDEVDATHPARTLTFNTQHYGAIDYGYAATIHKGQGVTVDKSYVLASRYMDSHATYVSHTRHRESVITHWSREEFKSEREFVQTLSRERAKDLTLDYTKAQDITVTIQSEKKVTRETISLALPSEAMKAYDAFLAESAKAYNKAQHSVSSLGRDDSFSRFTAQFEAEHPAYAKVLEDSVRPRHEREALAAEKQIQALEKSSEGSALSGQARKELEQYSAKLKQQAPVMDYLKQHKPELCNKIEQLAKSYERSYTLSRGRSR